MQCSKVKEDFYQLMTTHHLMSDHLTHHHREGSVMKRYLEPRRLEHPDVSWNAVTKPHLHNVPNHQVVRN